MRLRKRKRSLRNVIKIPFGDFYTGPQRGPVYKPEGLVQPMGPVGPHWATPTGLKKKKKKCGEQAPERGVK